MGDIISLGLWIKRRRKALDLTQDELAQRVGCSLETIRKIEADARRPSREIAARLAEKLELAGDERAAFIQAARAELSADRLAPPAQTIARGAFMPAPAAAGQSAPPATTATALPSGTVTFLFTDIEGSTQLWEQHPQAMPAAIERHNDILTVSITAHGGTVFKLVGDAVYAAFASAPQALTAALAAQRALAAERWGAIGPLRVRMALHTGSAEARDGAYLGPPLNRVARLLAAGHGGQILLSLATQDLVRDQLSDDTALRDLGTHRLKDLSRPEPIFQVVVPDLPADFPPLNTLGIRRTNLPVPPTPLIGRKRVLTEIVAMLRNSNVRLVTLTGPGGTGKTRLSLQAAAELLDDFAHGVYFVDLSPIQDADLVDASIAETLEVATVGDQPLRERLKDYLREKQLLLLLDNFEQVLEAAPLVAALLAVAPHLRVLVTSRVVLRLSGEQEFPVPPLSLPDPKHVPPLQQLTQYEAVRLFAERARAVKPDFATTDENARAVSEICYRLDGLPLAIELAAARSKVLPPDAILARLSNVLRLLSGGARDLPVRQQTLRNTIDWSYRLLTVREQVLFARLGVFVGGWTLEAAEAICIVDDDLIDPLDVLQTLADHSLIRQDTGHAGALRYRMLETIREYAREQLEVTGEIAELQQRHARYYAALAEAAEPRLRTAEQWRWLGRLDDEHDNIRAALDWCIESGDIATGLRLGGSLWQFWAMREHVHEGRARLTSLLSLAERSGEPVDRARAQALLALSILIGQGGERPASRPLLEQSIAGFRTVGDRWGLALALSALSELAFEDHDNAAMQMLHEESQALLEAIGDPWGRAYALVRQDAVAAAQGNPAARRVGLEGVRQLRALGDNWQAAIALNQLAGAYEYVHDLDWNIHLAEESLALAQEFGDRVAIGASLHSLAIALRYYGDYQRAAQCYDEVIPLWQELGIRSALGTSLHGRGMVACFQGDDQRATALFVASLALFREAQKEWAIGWCFQGLAAVAGRAGREGAQRAARLLAASGAKERVHLWAPSPRAEWERIEDQARAQLDDNEWAAAWAEGLAMSLDEAIAYALERS
jgi:predicted ATPase/class 3 adenylate cyclase